MAYDPKMGSGGSQVGATVTDRPVSPIPKGRVASARDVLPDLGGALVALVLALAVLQPTVALLAGGPVCALYVAARVLRGFRFRSRDLLVGVLAAWTLTSIGWSAERALSLVSALNFTSCAAIFLAVRASSSRARNAQWAVGALFAATCAVLAWIWFEHGVEVRLLYRADADRVGLPGINLNYTAYSLATAAVFLLALTGLWRTTRARASVAVAALLVMLHLGVMLTGTRAAMFSVAGVLVWWLVSRGWRCWAFRLVTTGFVAVNLALALGFLDALLRRVFPATGERENGDLNGRLSLWPDARELWSERVLQGHGVGSYPELNALGFDGAGAHAHNAVLDLGVGTGLVGVLLFFAALLGPLATSWRRTNGYAALVGGAFLVATLPLLLTGYWIEAPLLWASLGLVASLADLRGLPPHRDAPVVAPDAERAT